ncbi:hypothetical protein [Qipengyuania qiaonensis]|uniref:Uncharacterized protein n=1 Tax=Qipengyuania qiaonensis TaxID=2867240 RepID=A0ABS7J7A0_9SPHN|nr:hypothetical protein [Qipengyuania qiaonensis]MBX7483185.1 hypothetical protein [Qipengyuania qiaonensis]
MSLDLTTATARIARELGESELAIADALARTTALLHSAALASRDVVGAPELETQRTLLRLQKIVGGLIDARGETSRVHGELSRIAVETGAGEEPTCPDKSFTSAERVTTIAA